MKNFNGRAVYNPSGKAGEYAEYACNFYVGCSNGCGYCYLKKGVLATTMGQDKPQLKKCFNNEAHALEVFKNELNKNLPELQKHGLFFSFSTDPMLVETIELTLQAANMAIERDICVKILTKRADWLPSFCEWINRMQGHWIKKCAFGFTLTGHDKLEPKASTNEERVKAMKRLHEIGFKTFASIEPIIEIEKSKNMIEATAGFCDLYKTGLESGKKYDKQELRDFIEWCLNASALPTQMRFYFKDSLLKQAGIDRDSLPSNCVGQDYNMFNC